MRQCPKCGKTWKGKGRARCNADPKCETVTVEIIDWTDEDEAKAMQDLEAGEMEDPFEDYEGEVEEEPEPEPEPEEDLREDLVGQADQIHDILEKFGPLTYKEVAEKLDPSVSWKRASRLVSQMIRDGVELKREGSPRKVSIA